MGRPRTRQTLPGETAAEYNVRANRERAAERLLRLTPEQKASDLARIRVWAAANPERKKAAQRKYNLKKYNMTPEEERVMFENQEGLCCVCSRMMCLCNQKPRCATRAEIDHDHTTGEVRGMLCRLCNAGLGHFRDSPTFLRNAVGYLESA
jgi:hypothetical protein